MTRKKIMSVIAAATVMTSVSGTVFANSGATTTSSATYSLITATSYQDTYHTATINSGTADEKTTHNAMAIKKVLEVPDTSYIPNCKFDLTATAPAVLTGNANGLCVEPTSTTLGVYSGLHPELIKWGVVKTDATDAKFAANSLEGSAVEAASTTLVYASQNPTPSTTANTPTKGEDNVLINSTATDDKVYYAIKELQLDFEGCGFTEPGVYRYYIEEESQSTNVGITDDAPNRNTDGTEKADTTRFRTIDVYVDDASYTDSTSGEKQYKLAISGYVMYIGKVTGAPKNYKQSTTAPTADAALEDGLADHDLNGQQFYGNTNGAEVTGAAKSEGFLNKLETNKLTFKKIVTGNQGSMNKYFKFVLKLTGDATNSNIQDADTYIISTDTDETLYDKEPADNTATYYTSADMKTANNVTVVTGAQLKAGYAFYLHDGQFITITGIPKGLGYTITEYNEDYVPSVNDGGPDTTATYDTTNDGTNKAVKESLDKSHADNTTDVYGNYAVITDTKLTNNAYETFTNERKGTIPTGVVIATAAPVGVGIAAVAGIIALAVKSRKKKED